MANNRIFYAIQKAGIAPDGSKNYEVIRGLQSLSMNTTFSLEQIFEMGQLSIYENVEGLPNVEVTMEKVLDGWAPIYLLATQGAGTAGDPTPTNASLTGRSAVDGCGLSIAIYDEGNKQAYDAGGGGYSEVQMSGLFISAVGYTASVDGPARESITMVGNNKVWVGVAGYTSGTFGCPLHWDGTSSQATNTDKPYSISGSGGVNMREDVLFGSSAYNSTLLPGDIPGITVYNATATDPGSGCNLRVGDDYAVHVQSISIRTDLGRDELLELGRKGPYNRPARFPTEVTSEIVVIASSGDGISAAEGGLYSEGGCGTYNLLSHRIKLCLCEGLRVDAGSQNKLASVGYSGGDTGGGNVEVTYTYTNFNDFTVMHPKDPAVSLRPANDSDPAT